MLFNSIEFAIFLITVWVLYWKVFARHHQAQNTFLLVVSYVFYGWWDYRFLGLIFLSSLVDYVASRQIGAATRPGVRKAWVGLSLLVNLGALMFFKYFNFFADSLQELAGLAGITLDAITLNIILPVGISFYTFQTLSYTIDVYRKQIEPERNVINFFAYVSFFPQLVAGPIERASRLLPQFKARRTWDYAQQADGFRQILWGLTKKIVLADGVAYQVYWIYNNYEDVGGLTLLLGGFLFLLQIYGDFSGYSDIALGTAKLLGFRLMVNFNRPFFSKNFTDVWRRWHMSLGAWFRDYVYIPLGGNRRGRSRRVFNLCLTLLLMAFWHGASWNMIMWGVWLCIFQVPDLYFTRLRERLTPSAAWAREVIDGFKRIRTFALLAFSFIIFRADTFEGGLTYYKRIFTSTDWWVVPERAWSPYTLWIFAGVMLLEALQGDREHPLQWQRMPWPVRWLLYFGLSALIAMFFDRQISFIYFQF